MTDERLDFQFFLKLKFESEINGPKCVIDWCMNKGLITAFYKCPVCKEFMKLGQVKKALADGFMWRCKGATTQKHFTQRSIRKGTWFEKSHMSLIDILLITYMFVRGYTLESIKYELQTNGHTLADWRHFYRATLFDLCLAESGSIGGPDKVVVVDKCKFGERIRNTNCERNKKMRIYCNSWVLCGVEKDSSLYFLTVVEQINDVTLKPIIKKNIQPGSTIITDGWAASMGLEIDGYQHKAVEPKHCSKDPDAHMNIMKSTWPGLKKKLSTHGTEDQFVLSLGEYIWKKRRDKESYMRDFLEGVKKLYPPQISDRNSEVVTITLD